MNTSQRFRSPQKLDVRYLRKDNLLHKMTQYFRRELKMSKMLKKNSVHHFFLLFTQNMAVFYRGLKIK